MWRLPILPRRDAGWFRSRCAIAAAPSTHQCIQLVLIIIGFIAAVFFMFRGLGKNAHQQTRGGEGQRPCENNDTSEGHVIQLQASVDALTVAFCSDCLMQAPLPGRSGVVGGNTPSGSKGSVARLPRGKPEVVTLKANGSSSNAASAYISVVC